MAAAELGSLGILAVEDLTYDFCILFANDILESAQFMPAVHEFGGKPCHVIACSCVGIYRQHRDSFIPFLFAHIFVR